MPVLIGLFTLAVVELLVVPVHEAGHWAAARLSGQSTSLRWWPYPRVVVGRSSRAVAAAGCVASGSVALVMFAWGAPWALAALVALPLLELVPVRVNVVTDGWHLFCGGRQSEGEPRVDGCVRWFRWVAETDRVMPDRLEVHLAVVAPARPADVVPLDAGARA